MKLALPNNIFSRLFAQALPSDLRDAVMYKESALLAKAINEGAADIALIPSMDLLKHKEFFVSAEAGLSFDGSLSNSYFYFAEEAKQIGSLVLAGDISSVEAILARIAIHEMYDENVQISISGKSIIDGKQNILISGDSNFEGEQYKHGLDFAEEISELTSLPFVHYVFAGAGKDTVIEFGKRIEGIEPSIYAILENPEWQTAFTQETNNFLRENIQHVVYEFDSSDTQGLEQLIQLTYFHGIIQDIFDINYAR